MYRSILILLVSVLYAIGGHAETINIWTGNKSFGTWSDVLNIDGNQFRRANADDVVRFSMTCGSGAQFQLSYGSSWTNFDGLGAYSVSGDYDLVVNNKNLRQLKEGIHVKGVNFNLKSVVLLSNDGAYQTEHPSFFAWEDLVTSGAEKGQSCLIAMKPYSGAGWYWEEGKTIAALNTLEVELFQPASEEIIVQILYNTSNYRTAVVKKGETKGAIKVAAALKNVYSVNFLSEKRQSIALKSVNLIDKEGNTVTGIDGDVVSGAEEIMSAEYYSLSGIRLPHIQKGINIIVIRTKDGRTITQKIIK